MGLGLDIPNARAIIHIDLPYTLYEYAQESGRAGRDRIRSEAILLKPQDSIQLKRQLNKNEKFEQAIIREYIKGSRYRRSILSRYLDGSELNCQEHDEKCDICRSIDYSRPSKLDTRLSNLYIVY